MFCAVIQVQLCALEELMWSRLLSTDRPELFGEPDSTAVARQLPAPSWDQVWAAPRQVSAVQGSVKPAARGQAGLVALASPKPSHCFSKLMFAVRQLVGFPL